MASPNNAALQAALNNLASALNQFTGNLTNAGKSLQSSAVPMLAMVNSLGGSLGAMAGRITDMVLPGLGTFAETLRLPSMFDAQAVSDLLCHGLTVATALETLARDGHP